MLSVLIAMTTLVPQAQTVAQVSPRCSEQPLPPAIDSAGEPPTASGVIEFAATPSLEHPGKAWVMRISRRGDAEAKIDVLRLRRQEYCNRYDIEARWQAPLKQEEYVAIAAGVAPLTVPTPSVFVPSPTDQLPEIVMDGTSIDLRLFSHGWQVTRSLNHYSGAGAAISAIFRNLASKYVPASELPTEDWRTLPASE
ncbi:hypothetical protein [Sphingomonas sp. PB4P5]|uniref:hypothetical protein n=1 Tax=Parasphingomonas puruogangriensis TaxID=3096155 RepID=UPI002FC6CD24